MTLRVAILDMQPIDPPVGGGRLRLLGLYRDLGPDMAAQYVGSYDWPGPGFRRQFLSDGLEEILVPLSAAHFAAAEARARAVGGRVVIDTTFHELAHLSPDYAAAARAAAREADVVVVSHPWAFPLIADTLDRSRQLLVYDAHNVEGLLRTELLDDGGAGTEVARGVVGVEYAVCNAADLVLACSQQDSAAFARLYGVPYGKMRIAANGTFTRSIVPPSPEGRAAARISLGLPETPVAFFLGSDYGPNVDAARFIAEGLAPNLPGILFAVGGGAGDALRGLTPRPNLHVTGQLSEADKQTWLEAADLAINPMFGGSGTNIKMMDFMAAGLPIVTTPTGARGITCSDDCFVVAPQGDFANAVRDLAANPESRRTLGIAARTQAERFYSWEQISRHLGRTFTRHFRRLHRNPFFSVIIPTYERHQMLTRLIEILAQQSFRDFEIIVVDQSTAPWPDRDRNFGLDLCYVHHEIRGAVVARNAAAALATGTVVAFTDDDCVPPPEWLAAAHEAFSTQDIVGLEGLIVSDRHDDPDWRPVTNDGFEGIGFMTANLFVRLEALNAVGGFDVRFENPHFREDTDLGWRLQALGPVPFSRAAWLFHPPHSRDISRESLPERSRFFEKDALLMEKHPNRYVELFLRERQWQTNPYFWCHFLRGARQLDATIPEQIRAAIPPDLL